MTFVLLALTSIIGGLTVIACIDGAAASAGIGATLTIFFGAIFLLNGIDDALAARDRRLKRENEQAG